MAHSSCLTDCFLDVLWLTGMTTACKSEHVSDAAAAWGFYFVISTQLCWESIVEVFGDGVEAPKEAINIPMLQVVPVSWDTAARLLRCIELVHVQLLNPQLFVLYRLMSKNPLGVPVLTLLECCLVGRYMLTFTSRCMEMQGNSFSHNLVNSVSTVWPQIRL